MDYYKKDTELARRIADVVFQNMPKEEHEDILDLVDMNPDVLLDAFDKKGVKVYPDLYVQVGSSDEDSGEET